MSYKLNISSKANLDIVQAYKFYSTRSLQALENLDNKINQAYDILEKNPFFQIKYKNIRALPIQGFPYILFFSIDEKNKIVKIYALFNTHQNTQKYPK
ncbi:MAG: type II toxin-antitoxin system RelE/ParE family toxin [Flavobacteriales bacterium]|nr:type II toxin-antitoxin system RelE/ParE family toxin [Flavobacteriales bacterium]